MRPPVNEPAPSRLATAATNFAIAIPIDIDFIAHKKSITLGRFSINHIIVFPTPTKISAIQPTTSYVLNM